ncbi:MAG: ABC transporter substrate-binding protein [Opitutaceae bacterium]|jgi:iron complex transport system substrate-binding protein|nr:ABC transporter substrate-binding protein [Opitutaceae bacterium]
MSTQTLPFMRRALVLAAAAVALHAQAAPARPFTDGTGRVLPLPAAGVTRAYGTSPVGSILLYALAPEKLIGWNQSLRPEAARFLLPAVRDLPAYGKWFGPSGDASREALIAARPDVILSVGYDDATAVDFSDRLQRQTGIPVLLASGSLDDLAATCELLGRALGVEERAARLAAYCRDAVRDARDLARSLPPGRPPVRVYYAQGPRGLQTDTKGSLHAEMLELLGAENIIRDDRVKHSRHAAISMEHVIAGRPDVIIVASDDSGGASPAWLEDDAWRRVPAVAAGRVYVIPSEPFNWFDRPPSVNRLIGLKWLASVLHPDRVSHDMVAETRAFYRLFYHCELSEWEARDLLAKSRLPLPPPANCCLQNQSK